MKSLKRITKDSIALVDYTPDGKQIILSGDVEQLKMQIVLKSELYCGY
jgi:hypothetical protein